MTTRSAQTPLTADQARHAARQWVESEGSKLDGFRGAWLAGSLAWLPDVDTVPPWSDVDVMVVIDGATPPKLGKLLHQGALLEISFIEAADVATAEQLAANYRVNCSFVAGQILADPTGRLKALQASLRHGFMNSQAVADRIGQAREAAMAGLAGDSTATLSLPWRAMWVFPAGLPTHLPLLAAGENPTVRRRYEKVRPIFERGGRLDLYESLLAATGYGDLTRAEVRAHWEATRRMFDLAAPVSAQSSPFFASDISPVARAISIDGSLATIEAGFHREAVFWLVATQARSLAILEEVASEAITPEVEAGFQGLLARVGIETDHDRAVRSNAILGLVPEIEEFSLRLVG